MSITALVWLCIIGGLAVLAVVRASYGAALYLVTFFMFPSFWWWGQDLPDLRWNLLAGVVLVIAAAIGKLRADPDAPPARESMILIAIAAAMLINAGLVHLIMAPNASISLEGLTLYAKFVLLFVLFQAVVQSPRDMRILIWAMALGAAYIGYEVTINDRGSLTGSRLEGIGAAGVGNANQLASLMVAVLPLVGALFFIGNKWEKVLAAVAAGFILNVVILCNSRGAFLSLILAAAVFLLVSTGRARKTALRALALGGVAALLLLGDPDIVNRFMTTFSSAEERDSSASQRIDFWKAGFRMIADHPLGAGGFAFSKVYSGRYLKAVGVDLESRAVHNGFINEMSEWGVQGLLLHLCFIGFALLIARRAVQHQGRHGEPAHGVLGAAVVAATAGFLGTCMFGDFMDEEWGYWLVALMAGYSRVCAADAAHERTSSLQQQPLASPRAGAQVRLRDVAVPVTRGR